MGAAKWAKSQGAAIIFVTGRPSVMNIYTQINLTSVGYPVDGLYGGGLTTGSSGAGALADYKTATRASIEAQGYTIVANNGNRASDLSGGHALQTFKLPDCNGAPGRTRRASGTAASWPSSCSRWSPTAGVSLSVAAGGSPTTTG
ncbi:HAD family acid phosphatase [Nocardia tengchongensis]|uniref:HAD family acid phosphatase n=1 Tax=Nocardia tengchongensis TaxID=2055889 RepID=UPI0036CE2C53